MTSRDLRQLDRSQNPDTHLIPQVMTRDPDDLVWAANVLCDMGYDEINLNLGCPSGTVTAKGKGAGFLANPDALDRFFDCAVPRLCLPLSVKTRPGLRSPDEFPPLLDVFNRYPLAALTLHPRVAKDKYRGTIHMDMFAFALRNSHNPVCYNGDLRTVAEVDTFTRKFPDASAVMIGRGAVADPALFRKLRHGPPVSRDELQRFTRALYHEYQSFYGQIHPAAQRMREVWFYLIHMFDDCHQLNRQMRRFRGPAEYETAEAAIFAQLPLRTDSIGELV